MVKLVKKESQKQTTLEHLMPGELAQIITCPDRPQFNGRIIVRVSLYNLAAQILGSDHFFHHNINNGRNNNIIVRKLLPRELIEV